jgi:hypothetical protein
MKKRKRYEKVRVKLYDRKEKARPANLEAEAGFECFTEFSISTLKIPKCKRTLYNEVIIER